MGPEREACWSCTLGAVFDTDSVDRTESSLTLLVLDFMVSCCCIDASSSVILLLTHR